MTPAEKLAVIESMRAERKTIKEIGRALDMNPQYVSFICIALKITKPRINPFAPSRARGVGFAAEGAGQQPNPAAPDSAQGNAA